MTVLEKIDAEIKSLFQTLGVAEKLPHYMCLGPADLSGFIRTHHAIQNGDDEDSVLALYDDAVATLLQSGIHYRNKNREPFIRVPGDTPYCIDGLIYYHRPKLK